MNSTRTCPLVPLLCVVLLAQAAFLGARAQELFHGGEVILSTDHYLHYVQARADTVCVYATEYSAKVRPKLFQLHVDGSTWDSIEVFGYEGWDDAPGTSAMVGFENHFDTVLKQTVGAVWIARSINDVRIVNVGREGDLAPGHKIHQVVAHHYNPNVVIVTTFTNSEKYETAHITTDGGLTWKKFLPASTEHFHYGTFFFGFDARNPQRIHIGFERENPNDPFYDGNNSAYTDDWCETLIDTSINIDGRNAQDFRLPNTEKGLGIWSGAGGLSYFDPTFDRGPYSWHLTSDSLYLEPGEPPRRVRLPWLENARRDLLPSFDSATESFDYHGTYRGIVGYHSRTPQLVVTQFIHKTFSPTTRDSVIFTALSNDFGETWTKLAVMPVGHMEVGRKSDLYGTTSMSIDPSADNLYISFVHTKFDTLTGDFNGDSRTVLWRNIVTGVQSNERPRPLDRGFDIIPNPVSGTSTIRIRNKRTTHGFNSGTFNIYSAGGETVYTSQIDQAIGDEWEVKLPGLAPGVYFIIQTISNVTHSQKFIVLE